MFSFLCNVSLHANHRRITVRNLITTNDSIKIIIIIIIIIILTQYINF
jgi:hypothetical protein